MFVCMCMCVCARARELLQIFLICFYFTMQYYRISLSLRIINIIFNFLHFADHKTLFTRGLIIIIIIMLSICLVGFH